MRGSRAIHRKVSKSLVHVYSVSQGCGLALLENISDEFDFDTAEL